MKINYFRLVLNAAWLLFCVFGSITFPYMLYNYLFGIGWTNTYDGSIGISRIGGTYVELVVVIMLITTLITMMHLFNPDWDFWEALAKKFPANPPKAKEKQRKKMTPSQ